MLIFSLAAAHDDLKVPVELVYIGNGNEQVDAFESRDASVPCGRHAGSRLRIDQIEYQLEPFDVKHYSFEIHLYIEGDIRSVFLAIELHRNGLQGDRIHKNAAVDIRL